MEIIVMMTGGTISQKEVNSRMEIALTSRELLEGIATGADLEFVDISRCSGASLKLEQLFAVRDTVHARPDADGFLLITGTDSMEEFAFGLDLLLEPGRPFVVTGAAKPSDVAGYDGRANLQDALRVLESPEAAALGVLVVLNDCVHPARYLRKHDSTLIGMFQSHPGPMAQIRRGRPLYYYLGLPPIERYPSAQLQAKTPQVMIWTMALDPVLPSALLPALDGLVLAGQGTGSLAPWIVEQLSPEWTERIPVVLTSRCAVGLNFDDAYYRGSLEKYENRGFRLLGYEQLNPLQARIKLMLELLS
ncbi:asparaginase domain-containing protein [Anthocerotibacter panamensis]|uniref:asparaginase domain-containing protein n=1 Tax=Anthocerotibacter panamensis TaxID=2857077 RepID=UPI001C407357|nr:asparaginase domain-containing protein [Anthocerotibacter panamensis]